MEPASHQITENTVYREFLLERDEILCHKWIESEKLGYDIGFERALIEWITRYRSDWRKYKNRINIY